MGEEAGGIKDAWNILVAEDHPINQKLVVRMLESRGYRAEVAGSGREALDKLAKGTYDLILMDMQMPDMDGLEATRIIREKEQATGGHIPIIALTANALKGDRERCLEAGMDGYIPKPVQIRELFEAIRKFLSSGEPVTKAEGPAAPTS